MRDRRRNRVRRHPERGRYDRAAVDAVIDASLVAHVAFVDDGQPHCIPMLQARVADTVYVHGSSASRTLRLLGAGLPACLTVTTIDGLVLARSAFEHSANYRSAVLLGTFQRIDERSAKLAALEAFTNKLVPGRWDEVRPPSERELTATAIVGLPIEEAAVKIRTGPPSDDDSPDADLATWAGVLPLAAGFGEPLPSPGLRPGIPLSASAYELLGRNGRRRDG